MKYYTLGAILFAVGTTFMVTDFQEESSNSFIANPSSRSNDAENALKVQQAQLRRVNDEDLSESPSIRPVPENIHISSYFGMREHPVFKVRKMHWGIDFPAPMGTPILATAGGIIVETTTDPDSSSYGKHIVIAHDNVYKSLYAHLSKVDVKVGDEVAAGDTIGLSGNTGVSTNPHLHYEVYKRGKQVNPYKFLKKQRKKK